MNASKTLTSVAAALALVGTIGFASAQSGTDNTVNGTNATENVSASPASRVPQTSGEVSQQRSMEVAPVTTNQLPASDTTSAPADSSLDNQRAPQADRN